jgi:hypothetical protein
MIFGKKKKSLFSRLRLFETFLILRRIQGDIITKVKTSSCEVPVIFVGIYWNLKFLDRFSKNPQTSNFVKTRLVETELFDAHRQKDKRRDGYDKASSRFSREDAPVHTTKAQ